MTIPPERQEPATVSVARGSEGSDRCDSMLPNVADERTSTAQSDGTRPDRQLDVTHKRQKEPPPDEDERNPRVPVVSHRRGSSTSGAQTLLS